MRGLRIAGIITSPNYVNAAQINYPQEKGRCSTGFVGDKHRSYYAQFGDYYTRVLDSKSSVIDKVHTSLQTSLRELKERWRKMCRTEPVAAKELISSVAECLHLYGIDVEEVGYHLIVRVVVDDYDPKLDTDSELCALAELTEELEGIEENFRCNEECVREFGSVTNAIKNGLIPLGYGFLIDKAYLRFENGKVIAEGVVIPRIPS